ncbi:TPA: hypothetical protein ACRN3P_002859 [Pseudomonas aeruginosa]
MNKANECSCPSGDGSLVHPCPAHPAVEQAGGDERDFQAEGAQEVPSPVSQEYDRHLISLLRKGEALPGHQEEAADEIERLRDWNDHLNNTVLPNILNPTFLMLMKGGERLLDLCTKDGKFIGVSLNDMKDVFDWMVTHARIAPDHAALAQPSPAQTQPSPAPTLRAAIDVANDRFEVPVAKWGTDLVGEEERPEVAEVAFVLRNIGAMDAEDIDGDNVDLRFEDAEGRDTGCDVSIVEYAEKAADLFEQHERIVGALRAEITQLRQHKNDYMDAGQETYRALQNEIREREAEIARLDGLVSSRTTERDAALAEVERLRESKGDPVGSLEKCMKVMYERDEHAKRLEAAMARVAELEKELAMARDAAAKGDAARRAAGGMEMEIQELREKVTELQKELRSRWTYASTQATNCAGCGEYKHTPLRVDWMGGYVCLTCIDKKLEELHDDQAQHSVPEEFIGRLSEFLAQRGTTGKALLRELHAMLSAAPAQGGE